MKTTLYLTLTLLTFVMFTFVPNSFAQDFRPIVRLIYFVPSDRQPQSDMDTKLDKLIKEVQQGYEGIMEAHGFGKKTFLFETDGNGNAVVHTVNGQEAEKHYNDEEIINMPSIAREIQEQSFDGKNINLVAIDVSSPHLGGSANICGIAQAYRDYEGGGGLALMPASGPCFSIRVAAHELGHTFGLNHDFRSDAKLVESEIFNFTHLFFPTSFCAAEWLDVHRAFNAKQPISNEQPTIDMLPPNFVSSPNVIRLRFKVTDHDGIHQVQLRAPGPKVGNTTTGNSLHGCVNLNGNSSATVEFVTSSLTTRSEFVSLQMIDVQGTIVWSEQYPIDVLSLLPPPEVVKMPDANLAAAIKESLGLAPKSPITKLDMLGLGRLKAPRKQIVDLTGLQHAINLQRVDLSENQIVDLTPFEGLTRMTSLSLIRNKITDISSLSGSTLLNDLYIEGNRISDISPLAEFMNLAVLNISRNKIEDISPLAGLKELRSLRLDANPIKDVTPLVELVNLHELYVRSIPYIERKPLLDLLKKNPDVKIYLKHGGEPLPVTLSHFRAEHTDAGVVLKWTTESEVDNAGFYIYRSETREGEFKVVNPTMIQGAGTIGERNEYTWTDTTAKPNVAYYYQIEDVSYAGVRKQLATVRLKGLVSASGKLATSWGDLKRTQ